MVKLGWFCVPMMARLLVMDADGSGYEPGIVTTAVALFACAMDSALANVDTGDVLLRPSFASLPKIDK